MRILLAEIEILVVLVADRRQNFPANTIDCALALRYVSDKSRAAAHLGLILSLRRASWMAHALRMTAVNASPRGIPSTRCSSSGPPRPWPFVSCGERRARIDGPAVGWRWIGVGWKKMRSRRGARGDELQANDWSRSRMCEEE